MAIIDTTGTKVSMAGCSRISGYFFPGGSVIPGTAQRMYDGMEVTYMHYSTYDSTCVFLFLLL